MSKNDKSNREKNSLVTIVILFSLQGQGTTNTSKLSPSALSTIAAATAPAATAGIWSKLRHDLDH